MLLRQVVDGLRVGIKMPRVYVPDPSNGGNEILDWVVRLKVHRVSCSAMKESIHYVLVAAMSVAWISGDAHAASAYGSGESQKAEKIVDTVIEIFLDKSMFGKTARPSMLLLSGGGSYGPWGTGVLEGWKGHGRPKVFTVVTGVSTGAMIAPFAYLPYYMGRNIFPDYVKHADDIHRKRFILELPFANSLYSLSKLSKLIYQFMDPPDQPDEADGNYDSSKNQYNLLQMVGDSYDGNGEEDDTRGRRLLIRTVSMESGVFCAWNLGEIASRAIQPGNDGIHRRLFHDVLLASTAMPGFYPPVYIDLDGVSKPDEVVYPPDRCKSGNHADGGVRRQAFVQVASKFRQW